MAIDAISRWQIIRAVVLERKSGSLIAQLGRNFFHWVIESGNLLFVSSTLPQYSFTQFLMQRDCVNKERLLIAQSKITERKTLGSALMQAGLVRKELLGDLLRDHWFSLTFHLLQSTTHLHWSDREVTHKQEFVRVELPFAELILAAERSAVEIRTAIRFTILMPQRYRIPNWERIDSGLYGKEKRLLHYLKTGAPLTAMLKDAELDRLSCYRALFLLWLSGSLLERQPRKLTSSSSAKRQHPLLDRLRSVPPDWIFPLLAGVVIGILLAPTRQLEPPPPPPHIESLKDALDKPAWSVRKGDMETQRDKGDELQGRQDNSIDH